MSKIHPNAKCQPILPNTEISDQNLLLSPSKVLLHFFNQSHISLMYLNSWRWIFFGRPPDSIECWRKPHKNWMKLKCEEKEERAMLVWKEFTQ